MTPSATAKRRTASWLVLVLALVATATPSFGADRTVDTAANAPLLEWALNAGLPIVAYFQVGPVVFTAVLLPTSAATTQPADAGGSDNDKGSDKNGVILEDGAPF